MQLYVGTSGYSYKEWKGSFYPEKLPQKEMLRYYAERLSTVEVNNSFYRLPASSVIESWTQQVPANFRFVLKAPQAITHFKQLRNCEEPVEQLLQAAEVLRERRGPILFQLPPHLKKDVPRLEAFLQIVGGRTALAFEFRHESWFDDDVFACLKEHHAAHCLADAEDLPAAKIIRTADWGYVRLRRANYTKPQLRKWTKELEQQGWDHAYVFFKHEDTGTGPRFATQFLELIGSSPAS